MKTYSISEAAKLLNLPASTIRYYDSCGAFPAVCRNNAGRRIFTESDIKLIAAMRRSLDNGMSISEFRRLYEVVMVHDNYSEGRQMLIQKVDEIDEKICQLQRAQIRMRLLIEEYGKYIEPEKDSVL